VLGPPISFSPLPTQHGWSPSLPIHLTSAATLYKGAKAKMPKANILAATVIEIMAKAQEDTRALPDDLKKVCLHACVLYYTVK